METEGFLEACRPAAGSKRVCLRQGGTQRLTSSLSSDCHMHKHTHACAHTHTHTHTHIHTHIQIHAHTYTHIQTYTDTHTHTHGYTHTLLLAFRPLSSCGCQGFLTSRKTEGTLKEPQKVVDGTQRNPSQGLNNRSQLASPCFDFLNPSLISVHLDFILGSEECMGHLRL